MMSAREMNSITSCAVIAFLPSEWESIHGDRLSSIKLAQNALQTPGIDYLMWESDDEMS